jgi:hypothetical protein
VDFAYKCHDACCPGGQAEFEIHNSNHSSSDTGHKSKSEIRGGLNRSNTESCTQTLFFFSSKFHFVIFLEKFLDSESERGEESSFGLWICDDKKEKLTDIFTAVDEWRKFDEA